MSKVGIMYQREKEQSWSQAISEALASPAWQRLNHVAPQGVVLHPSWRGQVPPYVVWPAGGVCSSHCKQHGLHLRRGGGLAGGGQPVIAV